jgi:hypothetical protein
MRDGVDVDRQVVAGGHHAREHFAWVATSGPSTMSTGPVCARVPPTSVNVGASVSSGYPAMPLSVAR